MEIVAIPRVLRQKWGDDEVDAMIELINKSSLKLKEDVLVFVEDKFERKPAEEIPKVNLRIIEEISQVKKRIVEDGAKLNLKITENHTDIIKWMFIFWAGQIGIMVGLFALFK